MREFIRNTRRIGIMPAWRDFIERRHLRTLAYLALAASVALAFAAAHSSSVNSRKALARATYNVVVADCQGTNTTRSIMRTILTSSETQLKREIKAQRVPAAVGQENLQLLRADIALAANSDCTQVARAILRTK